MTNTKINLSKEDILNMSREQIVDFLLENWEHTKILPDARAKDYMMTRTDLHTMEKMQSVAFELIGQ